MWENLDALIKKYSIKAKQVAARSEKTIFLGFEWLRGIYDVRRHIAGRVFLIEKDGKFYALKDLSSGFFDVLREGFSNRVRLNHPNVVRIVSFGFEPKPYVVMEYVDGESLRDLLNKRGGKLDCKGALRIFKSIVEAVCYAHGLEPPVFYRDLKPENILLPSKGVVKVGDWGFSCTPGTSKGVVGTPPYIAPESYSRGEYTVKSDAYALGFIFYETLTGTKFTPRPTIKYGNSGENRFVSEFGKYRYKNVGSGAEC